MYCDLFLLEFVILILDVGKLGNLVVLFKIKDLIKVLCMEVFYIICRLLEVIFLVNIRKFFWFNCFIEVESLVIVNIWVICLWLLFEYYFDVDFF